MLYKNVTRVFKGRVLPAKHLRERVNTTSKCDCQQIDKSTEKIKDKHVPDKVIAMCHYAS